MYLVNGNKIWYPGIFPGRDIYVVPPQSWGDQGDTKHSDASS